MKAMGPSKPRPALPDVDEARLYVALTEISRKKMHSHHMEGTVELVAQVDTKMLHAAGTGIVYAPGGPRALQIDEPKAEQRPRVQLKFLSVRTLLAHNAACGQGAAKPKATAKARGPRRGACKTIMEEEDVQDNIALECLALLLPDSNELKSLAMQLSTIERQTERNNMIQDAAELMASNYNDLVMKMRKQTHTEDLRRCMQKIPGNIDKLRYDVGVVKVLCAHVLPKRKREANTEEDEMHGETRSRF